VYLLSDWRSSTSATVRWPPGLKRIPRPDGVQVPIRLLVTLFAPESGNGEPSGKSIGPRISKSRCPDFVPETVDSNDTCTQRHVLGENIMGTQISWSFNDDNLMRSATSRAGPSSRALPRRAPKSSCSAPARVMNCLNSMHLMCDVVKTLSGAALRDPVLQAAFCRPRGAAAGLVAGRQAAQAGRARREARGRGASPGTVAGRGLF
jgi:hypothetical protein